LGYEGEEVNWNSYKCPFCGDEALMGIMSIVANSQCGAIYVANWGWAPSKAYYDNGGKPL
jgi:hypothetical protein